MYIMADASSNKNAYSLLTMTNTEHPHSQFTSYPHGKLQTANGRLTARRIHH